MKNVTYQRGLICMHESEFNRVIAEVTALETVNAQLTQQLEESKKRVMLLEDSLRIAEAELRSQVIDEALS